MCRVSHLLEQLGRWPRVLLMAFLWWRSRRRARLTASRTPDTDA
jgi:hypothetical protein